MGRAHEQSQLACPANEPEISVIDNGGKVYTATFIMGIKNVGASTEGFQLTAAAPYLPGYNAGRSAAGFSRILEISAQAIDDAPAVSRPYPKTETMNNDPGVQGLVGVSWNSETNKNYPAVTIAPGKNIGIK